MTNIWSEAWEYTNTNWNNHSNIELFENILGEQFVKADISNIHERIEKNVLNFLKK